MKNSWYIKTDNLHHFICKCGQHDIVEESETHNSNDFEIIDFKREEIDLSKFSCYHPDNICSSCSNEKYLDMEALLNNGKTLYWSSLSWDYKEVYHAEKKWSVISYIEVPKLNLFKNEVIAYKVELSSYDLDADGQNYYHKKHKCFLKKRVSVDGNFKSIDDLIKEEMSSRLTNLVLTKPSKNLKWLNGEALALNELVFCLENPNIRSVDMVKWRGVEYFLEVMNHSQYVDNFLEYLLNNHKEKSVKKALFSSYKEMMSRGGYNPMADYIFCRAIHDVNHLTKVLTLESSIKMKLFENCSVENIFLFFEFLQKFYQERHIVYLFKSINHDDLYHNLVEDSISLFRNREYREEFSKNFQKTSLSIWAIHHELTRHSRRLQKIYLKEEIFSYSDSLLQIEGSYEGIEYKLPFNSLTLYQWGEELHNCLFSYKDRVLRGNTTIVGLFVNGNLTYALEIKGDRVVQLSASFNRRLEESEREKVDRWFKKVYMRSIVQMIDG